LRERHRERHRETQRDTERHRETQRDTERHRGRDRELNRLMKGHTDTDTGTCVDLSKILGKTQIWGRGKMW